MSSDDARQAAIRRIHEDELNRLDSILASYELERANAKHGIRMLCEKFGANHVAAWVIEAAEQIGQRL